MKQSIMYAMSENDGDVCILHARRNAKSPRSRDPRALRALLRSCRARYFVPRLGSALPRGVWKRIGRSSIQPVLIFVKSVLYSPRYDFFEITRRSADAHFPGNFALAFGQALSTARK